MGDMGDQNPGEASSIHISESNSTSRSNGWRYFNVADDVLAKQFYLLPFQNRNDIAEEIHGVRSMACEETPELIEESLGRLSTELQNLPMPYRAIYQRACNQRTNTAAERSVNDANESLLSENMDVETAHEMDTGFSSEQEIPSASCYVTSRNFQLAFLRCEFFDAKKAAIRLAKYLELTCDLYGEESLQRPLRIDDFKSKEEIDILNAGFQQLLPFRDRSGRRVLFVHGDLNLPSSSLMARSVLSKGPAMKVLLYLWSVLIEDVEAQRQGFVMIFWPRYNDSSSKVTFSHDGTQPAPARKNVRNKNRKRNNRKPRKSNQGVDYDANDVSTLVPDTNSRSTGIRFFEAVPVRLCAIHLCMPDVLFLRMVRQVILFIVGENYRTRIKTHQGAGMEIIYALMGYGIPVDTLPFDETTQTLKTKNLVTFMKVRRKIEAEHFHLYNLRNTSSGTLGESSDASISSEASNPSSMIECPSLHDVIFRSGKSYMNHPGNMKFRELIEHHINEHNVASQDRKKNLTWQVIEEVETKGGRFLEYSRGLGTWTELTDRNVIRHKIATYFKEFRRKVKAQRLTQMNQSSTYEFEAQDGRKRRKQNPNFLSGNCCSEL